MDALFIFLDSFLQYSQRRLLCCPTVEQNTAWDTRWMPTSPLHSSAWSIRRDNLRRKEKRPLSVRMLLDGSILSTYIYMCTLFFVLLFAVRGGCMISSPLLGMYECLCSRSIASLNKFLRSTFSEALKTVKYVL